LQHVLIMQFNCANGTSCLENTTTTKSHWYLFSLQAVCPKSVWPKSVWPNENRPPYSPLVSTYSSFYAVSQQFVAHLKDKRLKLTILCSNCINHNRSSITHTCSCSYIKSSQINNRAWEQKWWHRHAVPYLTLLSFSHSIATQYLYFAASFSCYIYFTALHRLRRHVWTHNSSTAAQWEMPNCITRSLFHSHHWLLIYQ